MNQPSLERLQPQYVRHFEPYTPSKPDAELKRLYGCEHLHRLNNNENPLGPPLLAQAVIRDFAPPRAALYPSGDAYDLRRKLAARFGKQPDQFLVGNGANEVIAFVIKAFCEPGDNILTADRTFAVYEWVATFSGIEPRLIPLRDLAFDAEAMAAAIDARTKVVCVCNPNNPTGTYWRSDRLRWLLERIDGRCILVVDEAYCEFVEADDFPDGMRLIDQYPNLVVFRTFSKMYGLAGLRIGYLAGQPEVVHAIRRTCIVYSVNTLAQAAAEAALDDDDHLERTRALVRESRVFLTAELRALGLPFVAGEGNFVMLRLPMGDTLAYRRLMQQGFMIRAMTGFRFPDWIRVSLAGLEVMEGFVGALRTLVR
ncbi:histidinol-phosphate transaminase [Thiocystis minor]|uniref:histidinol-phosphate transaminase n=1 Tax=Thiocystis minor TaxID=61597 RepID=UPI0019149DBF|nr:histidinol-phosphate transaminase [Thiocystis minor]MBK5964695.1 histidinol-phosphate transaminase [Thiocystis minor]